MIQNGHPLRPPGTPCSVRTCLALAHYLPRLVFRPAQPRPGVAARSAVLLNLPLCEDDAHRLQEDPGKVLTDERWRVLEDAYRGTGRELPERDEVTVELVSLAAWSGSGGIPDGQLDRRAVVG